jgi:hypothetical protein
VLSAGTRHSSPTPWSQGRKVLSAGCMWCARVRAETLNTARACRCACKLGHTRMCSTLSPMHAWAHQCAQHQRPQLRQRRCADHNSAVIMPVRLRALHDPAWGNRRAGSEADSPAIDSTTKYPPAALARTPRPAAFAVASR